MTTIHNRKFLSRLVGGIVLALTFLNPVVANAIPTQVALGGTGSTTLSGILIGNGTSPINTLTIGSNLTLVGTTLSASGGSGGSGIATTSLAATWPILLTITNPAATYSWDGLATSSAPTIGNLAYWTGAKTLGTVATSSLSGGGPITVSNSPSILGGSTATLGCTNASNGVTGCMSATDWGLLHTATTTFSAPLTYTASTNAVTCATCNIYGWPFTPSTYGGTANQSTTTPLWLKNTMVIASTTYFTQASTTMFTNTGSEWLTGITNGLVSADANGLLSASSSVGANFITGTLGNVNTTAPLGGGGALTRGSTLTLTCTTAAAGTAGCVTAADWQAFNLKVATSAAETDGQLAYWTTTNGSPAKLASVATSSLSVGSGLTVSSGTLGSQVGGTAATIKQIENKSFSYATTTWTGTTTISLELGYGEVWNFVNCFTDVGTLNTQFGYYSASTTMFNASTTAGKITFTSNNTMTSGNKVYVDLGTPATAPTKVTCTVNDTN